MKRKNACITLFLPLFYVSKALGLAPFYLDGQNGARRFKVSHFALAYFIALRVISLLGQTLGFFYSIAILSSDRFFSVASASYAIFYLFSSVMLFIVLLIKFISVLNLINRLSDIGILIFNKINRKDTEYRIWYWMLACGLFIQLFIVILVVIGFNTMLGSHNIYIFLIHNTAFYGHFTYHVIDFYLINILFLLKQYFSIINSIIYNVMDEFHSSEVTKRFKRMNHLHMPLVSVNSTKSKLKELEKLHFALCNIAEFTNSTYNMKILLVIINRFLITLTSAYFAVVTVLNYDRGDYIGSVWNILSAVSATSGIAQLTAVLWSASATAKEANRSKLLVHRLLCKTQDVEIREELELFSLQISHHKIQFTVCGFFPLDLTLLYSIIGALTTQVVILVQFQMSLLDQQSSNITCHT